MERQYHRFVDIQCVLHCIYERLALDLHLADLVDDYDVAGLAGGLDGVDGYGLKKGQVHSEIPHGDLALDTRFGKGDLLSGLEVADVYADLMPSVGYLLVYHSADRNVFSEHLYNAFQGVGLTGARKSSNTNLYFDHDHDLITLFLNFASDQLYSQRKVVF